MDVYAFYSAGGYARETLAGFIAARKRAAGDFATCFIDDDPAVQGTKVHGCPVLSYDEAASIPGLQVNVAFAGPALRRKKVERCEQDGLRFFSSIAPTVIIGDNVEIEQGAIFSHYSMVTADAKIGRHFHCNIYSYVAHDCIVGDFVTLAPRVSLNGRIKVEDGVYIGSDATFLPGKPDKFMTIGAGAVIGAGAMVTKDVKPGAVMVGNPARPR